MGETIDYDGMEISVDLDQLEPKRERGLRKKSIRKNIMNFLVGLGLTIPLMFFTMVLWLVSQKLSVKWFLKLLLVS